MDTLRKEFAKFGKKGFSPVPLLMNAVSNVICSVAFGQRFDYDDQEFKILIDLVLQTLTVNFAGNVLNFLPWLQVLPNMRKRIDEIYAIALKTHNHVGRLVESHIESVKEDLKDGAEPTNFLQALAKEAEGDSERATVLCKSHKLKRLLQIFGQNFILGVKGLRQWYANFS